jgi:hypothetical protein
MTRPLTIETSIHFERRGRGSRKEMREGESPAAAPRFMALAIRFDDLLASGAVADYAELARLAHVTRARITQIMNLRMLAPDLQEALLFLPRTERGRDPLHLRQLQPIALTPDWRKQRRMWGALGIR